MTRTTVKVYLEDVNGNTDSFTTSINLAEQEAHDYYLNKWWNMGTEGDHMMKCNRVETLQIEQDGRIIMPSYKQKFAKWREKYKGEINDNLHEVVETELTFKVGDRVTYTNDYGVVSNRTKCWDSANLHLGAPVSIWTWIAIGAP